MVNFIWFTDDKLLKFYHYSHKITPKKITFTHMWKLDFYIFQQDSAPARTACEIVELLVCEMLGFMPPCCLVLIRLTFIISEPDRVHRRSRVATDSTSWDRQVYTHDTLWRQHYITTSKEYLTNFHILLKYFKLQFSRLCLAKFFLGKLIIIWVNYERKKNGAFFMKHHVGATIKVFIHPRTKKCRQKHNREQCCKWNCKT